MSRRALLWAIVYLASAGLALHLVLPQLPGIRRSLGLVAGSSGPLLVAAFGAILASFLCYGELLGRSAGAAAGFGASLERRRRRGLGRFFTLRLTVVVHGAYRVLPGGGGATAAVAYAALRTRGLSPAKVGLAVTAAGALMYGVLGAWLLMSLLYLVLDRELNRLATLGAFFLFALTIAAFVAAFVAQRRPGNVRRALSALLYGVGRPFLRRRWSRERTEDWAERVVSWLRDEAKALGDQLIGSPSRALKLGALALGYWAFDALCLIVVFLALGVEFGVVGLLVAYGVATAFGNLPITPGGLGTFEAAMLGTLALLGYGPEATIPVLGYRLFNFWLPIPLAVLLYPTLHFGAPDG
ncbi:MAG TPA: lysylphosphatidylglycerol synthase transmembrane domain-containing protein [Rubrobacter sp.]|nr:lysylphosphatidylglycerol synthase transmembrane domain-containing protein [Rubrobacter sp.]